MRYWILMTLLALLIPVLMIGFGYYYRARIPKTMRSGYRTARSKKSRETWVYAHRMLGVLFRRLGWLLLAVSVCVMVFMRGKDEDTLANVSGTLNMVQAAVMALSFIPVEHALKRNFDENGFPLNDEAREASREESSD